MASRVGWSRADYNLVEAMLDLCRGNVHTNRHLQVVEHPEHGVGGERAELREAFGHPERKPEHRDVLPQIGERKVADAVAGRDEAGDLRRVVQGASVRGNTWSGVAHGRA